MFVNIVIKFVYIDQNVEEKCDLFFLLLLLLQICMAKLKFIVKTSKFHYLLHNMLFIYLFIILVHMF